MELNLMRVDFAQVGATNRSCMRVIPSEKIDKSKKKRPLEKVVVGSQNGCVICLCRKSNDTQIIYKTLPGPPIEAVCLGGAIGTLQDKVFVASGSNVRGIGKKGKQFFSFDTSMAETAKRMFIHGVDLLLTGQKSVNHYHDCADTNYVLCPGDILDVVCLISSAGAWGGRPFTSVVACADATIRVIEGSSIAYEIQLSSVPMTLYLFMGDGGHTKQLVLYGTRDGKLGLIDVKPKDGEVKWEINTMSEGGITAIKCYPFTGSDYPDILLGKDDGVLEIYTVDSEDRATLNGVYHCDESITGLDCGRITSEEENEIVICTYTGWLFSLVTTKSGAISQTTKAASVNVKVQQLKNEIEELETKLNEERQRYGEMTKKGGAQSAYLPAFQIHDTFEFSPQHNAYSLTIELVIPIDFIIVQSKMPARLVEVERNASVVCQQPQSEYNPWSLLASYRCQANVSRIELRVKVDEGTHGPVVVYICPKAHPKTVQIRSYEVKPLSSHNQVHTFDISRPLNTLSFSGNFSLAEAHSWLSMIVPGVPSKPPPTDTVTVNYQSTSNAPTQLQAIYSKGSITFRSDSISTIAIIRDIISEETTNRQIKVQISCDVNDASIDYCLKLMHPRMTHLLNLERRKLMAAALKELESNSGDVSFLSEQNKKILREHDTIFQDAEKDSIEESNICGLYEALLVNRARLHGQNQRESLDSGSPLGRTICNVCEEEDHEKSEANTSRRTK
ncbi:Bardet-Biedl syndrome 7 protein [Trichostrongylus colubriformis]|uniref:Bardet-Biedl syndrome 7 protein n=1 Tax=Trichostrongylus colubriformis TaxID=6319 RepID=A0AAN8FTS1_TRICO